MKKIVVAIDGLKFSESAAKYAIHLAKQSGAHLTGVFLDDFTYHSYKLYDLITSEGITDKQIQNLKKKDKEIRDRSVIQFDKDCEEAGIKYNIRHDRNIAIRELLSESLYADLLIIDRKEVFTHYEEDTPSHFMRDLLVNTECPVMVAPKDYHPVDKALLLYDADPSSVYAIKMYSYLFPFAAELPTEVLSVMPADQSENTDNYLMKELMKRHFSQIIYTVLKGEVEEKITTYVKQEHHHPLIVLGAYRRSMVSRWLKPSMADVLMKDLDVPLLIAHR